jgi:mono/diheme cytochrome c family protein
MHFEAGPSDRERWATIERYCTDCHNPGELAGGFAFDDLSADSLRKDAELWETAIRKLRGGFMPPPGEPHPGPEAINGLAAWIEASRDAIWHENPQPGAPVLHRLNRAEYANAIRDLLDLPFAAATHLPADDSSAGFDNIASALSVSPALMQAYVSAAARISRLAIGDPSISPGGTTYSVPRDVSQEIHVEGLPLGTRGGLLIEHVFPLDAEYEIRVGRSGRFFGLRNVASDDPVVITLNGEAVAQLSPADGGRIVLPVSAGPQRIGAAMVAAGLHRGVNDLYSQWADSTGITSISILGPLNATGPGDTPSRRRIFVCTPTSADTERGCAREILSRLATRAYRRQVATDEAAVDVLMQFYESGYGVRGFESGIQYALARVLVDPEFIFRFEHEPEDADIGDVYALNEFEIATRLSFFLWSTIPDAALMEAAADGTLATSEGRQQHVLRMLADAKTDALMRNFAGQWFDLRTLESVLPETQAFDGNLRRSFRRETELLFENIVRADRSIFDLLDADYTFVDERLARHYGIPNIRGSRFRRISVENTARRGLLGHGSFLTVTSAPNRTSPVIRGAWVLENILGTPPPSPPPGVETDLDQSAAAINAPETLRQRLERHRSDPSCAACHALIDPIGFALENFDSIGAWRDEDVGQRIDPATTLWDGSEIQGPSELRRILMQRRELFAIHATEKLLTYALGRSLEAADMPAVRGIVEQARDADYRFSALVLGIVESVPFRMKTKLAATPAEG